MNKVTLELTANSGKVSYVLVGEQKSAGVEKCCTWEPITNDKRFPQALNDILMSSPDGSPQRAIAIMEQYAEKEGFDDIEIKYCRIKDE